MYLIIVILTVLIVLSYYAFKQDLFSVSFLLYVGYFMSAIAATYNALVWGMDISYRLVFILCLGWGGFFFAELFEKYFVGKRKFSLGNFTEERELHQINVQKVKVLIIIGINMIITFMLFREVSKIAGSSAGVVGNMITNYKANASEKPIGALVTQLVKFTKGTAFILLFVFINNLISAKKVSKKLILKNLILLIPGFIYCIQCILKGGRFDAIAFVIGAIFIYYFLMQYKHNWKYKIKIKTLLKIVLLLIALVYAFWFFREFVGRTSDAGLVEYITGYIGGSYELFDLYLEKSPAKAVETFGYMVRSINKIIGTNIPAITYHEFGKSHTGILIGNTYTGMRNYYNDFGYIGVFLMSFVFSWIYNVLYCRLTRTRNIYKHTFLFIFYTTIIYAVVYHFFSEYFFARLSIGYFIEVLVMYICYLFIFKTKIKL